MKPTHDKEVQLTPESLISYPEIKTTNKIEEQKQPSQEDIQIKKIIENQRKINGEQYKKEKSIDKIEPDGLVTTQQSFNEEIALMKVSNSHHDNLELSCIEKLGIISNEILTQDSKNKNIETQVSEQVRPTAHKQGIISGNKVGNEVDENIHKISEEKSKTTVKRNEPIENTVDLKRNISTQMDTPLNISTDKVIKEDKGIQVDKKDELLSRNLMSPHTKDKKPKIERSNMTSLIPENQKNDFKSATDQSTTFDTSTYLPKDGYAMPEEVSS